MRTIKTNPQLAVVYLRASTDDQRLSPAAQSAAVDAYAASANLAISAAFMDLGISGASNVDERPGLLAAMDALRAARAGVLLVAKRDRIARDVLIAATVERIVARAGAVVLSAAGEGNGATPADEFMRTVIDGAAAYERALIRGRTKAALAAKKARGECVGECPYGYVADASGRLVPEPTEQAIISQVRALASRGLGVRRVAAALAAAGHVGRSGKALGPTQVYRIVRAQ